MAQNIDDPGGGADDNVPGEGSINSVVNELDDPGGGNADDSRAIWVCWGAIEAPRFLMIYEFPLPTRRRPGV